MTLDPALADQPERTVIFGPLQLAVRTLMLLGDPRGLLFSDSTLNFSLSVVRQWKQTCGRRATALKAECWRTPKQRSGINDQR